MPLRDVRARGNHVCDVDQNLCVCVAELIPLKGIFFCW